MSSVKCPRCGISNFSTAVTCKRCNSRLASGARSTDSYRPDSERPIADDIATASTDELAPPRTLGILLTVLGAALGLGGVILLVMGSASPYFLVAGIGIAASGVLIAVGKRIGLFLYFATVGLMLIWSLMETGLDPGKMITRLALPVLIGIYLLSGKVRVRLK